MSEYPFLTDGHYDKRRKLVFWLVYVGTYLAFYAILYQLSPERFEVYRTVKIPIPLASQLLTSPRAQTLIGLGFWFMFLNLQLQKLPRARRLIGAAILTVFFFSISDLIWGFTSWLAWVAIKNNVLWLSLQPFPYRLGGSDYHVVYLVIMLLFSSAYLIYGHRHRIFRIGWPVVLSILAFSLFWFTLNLVIPSPEYGDLVYFGIMGVQESTLLIPVFAIFFLTEILGRHLMTLAVMMVDGW